MDLNTARTDHLIVIEIKIQTNIFQNPGTFPAFHLRQFSFHIQNVDDSIDSCMRHSVTIAITANCCTIRTANCTHKCDCHSTCCRPRASSFLVSLITLTTQSFMTHYCFIERRYLLHNVGRPIYHSSNRSLLIKWTYCFSIGDPPCICCSTV